MRVDFFRHNITAADRKALERTLKGLFISTGDEVGEFEKKFANYLGVPYAVGVTSATAGLHLALEALGVGKGDEVITTPMTFIATANSILHTGARPVFVDVERDTGNIDANLIEKAITKKTKAIMPVHLYGQLCDMKAIKKIARAHKLKIIEDAAHSVEARRDGVGVGQLGDAAAFSFYATKNMTSGEGGAISVQSAKITKYLRQSRIHGMSKDAAERFGKKFSHYDMHILGWKYNMSNIQASLLLNQVDRVEKNLKMRERVWKMYLKELAGVDGVSFPVIREGSRSALHLFTVQVSPKKRDKVLWKLEAAKIGVAVNFRPVHTMAYYKKNLGLKRGMFPNAEAIGDSVITLPFYPTLKLPAVKYVCDSLKKALKST
ncbi:4-keto-6-deoxy-N-Acetyl-D-hexosaminyl-(Lipid carrier) aminotransferase [hydrothermal vent metagenome]|uniref:4-keto-6-deoxy-N-Acetyl-D-hexosaminyl-(Lipid carrier) aminotransferase n=1 Tax=hydrothermal vent metagenome TaxID=652676 RepID=A0A3B1C077_9ZZZZ